MGMYFPFFVLLQGVLQGAEFTGFPKQVISRRDSSYFAWENNLF